MQLQSSVSSKKWEETNRAAKILHVKQGSRRINLQLFYLCPRLNSIRYKNIEKTKVIWKTKTKPSFPLNRTIIWLVFSPFKSPLLLTPPHPILSYFPLPLCIYSQLNSLHLLKYLAHLMTLFIVHTNVFKQLYYPEETTSEHLKVSLKYVWLTKLSLVRK